MTKSNPIRSRTDSYYTFFFGWVHFVPELRFDRPRDPLHCENWRPLSGGRRGRWEDDAEALISELEHKQSEGDVEGVAEQMDRLGRLRAHLLSRLDEVQYLIERTESIRARHEPSAGERRQF